MIKPPSVQGPYDLIYSGDPALNLPADDDEHRSERDRVLKLARETGRWTDLIAEGQTPTAFTVKPLTGSQFDWWQGEVRRHSLIDREAGALALRLALRSVSGLGEYDKITNRVNVDGQSLAKLELIDGIYAAAGSEGAAVVLELASLIVERASEAPSPK